MKICFAASSGGHFEQLMMLKPLMDANDSFILTEKVPYAVNTQGVRTHFLPQVNRHERGYRFKMVRIGFRSLAIFLRERPDVIICTGVLATIPMCLLMKIFHRKLIFIESFAKVSSPTETGKFLYKYADRFYVQWESMKEFYPDAIYVGGIY